MLLPSNLRHFFRQKFPFLVTVFKKGIYLRNLFFYRYLCVAYQSNKKLEDFRGYGQGRRCFIVGNGPSLQANDLDKLIGEDCFACNHIEKIFDSTKWRPLFYTITDVYFGDTIDTDLYKYIFLSAYFLRKHKQYLKKSICLNIRDSRKNGEPVFSNDVSCFVGNGYTVTFPNIQIAAYMGYSEIYLLGIDNDWAYTLDSKGKMNELKKNQHFYEEKTMNDKIENNPANTNVINKAYISAKKYCDSHGIKIYNATRGGKLEVFERVDFDSLF